MAGEPMSARMRLRRADGRVYLDRWGFEWPAKQGTGDDVTRRPLFGVFVHRMDAPDPGIDLHDHPWAFASLILRGGYTEERADIREASKFAEIAEHYADCVPAPRRGHVVHRRWLSVRTMRLDECHRITDLDRTPTWTLVVHGRFRRVWGFHLPHGWMTSRAYDQTVRAQRRDMWAEISNDEPVASP
jgi:hypothetical protein